MKHTLLFIIVITVFSCSTTKNKVTSGSEDKILAINKTSNKIKSKVDTCFSPIPDTSNIIALLPPEEIANTQVDDNDVFIEYFNHDIFNELLENNISDKGDTNYSGFIKNKTVFKSYLASLSENIPTEKWTTNDKLAYWMNAYNAFTIKLIIDNYPTKSIKDIKNAWGSRFFKLGNKWYNLSDIEHKILRKMNDPRIHFGINCASYSCPPISNKAFTANNVNKELDYLAHQFINDKSRNIISENSIQLSKIFQWYAKDFKTEGSLIDYLNKYSDITINSNAKKSFKKYDWRLNEAHNGHY